MNFPKITELANSLRECYLESEHLKLTLKSMSSDEKDAFIRQWMTEGIPFCFKECPVAYEYSRFYLSSILNVHPKTITLIGSGRFGFSLDPKKFGAVFSDESDLDLSCISYNLFNDIVEDFNTWLGEYKKETVRPINELDRYYWDENSIGVPRNISDGFIDLNKIPTNPPRYLNVKRAQVALADLKNILKGRGILKVRKISLRIFKDWDSAISRYRLNLDYSIKDL